MNYTFTVTNNCSKKLRNSWMYGNLTRDSRLRPPIPFPPPPTTTFQTLWTETESIRPFPASSLFSVSPRHNSNKTLIPFDNVTLKTTTRPLKYNTSCLLSGLIRKQEWIKIRLLFLCIDSLKNLPFYYFYSLCWNCNHKLYIFRDMIVPFRFPEQPKYWLSLNF